MIQIKLNDKRKKLLEGLPQFTGTECYYKENFCGKKYFLTEGTKYLAEVGGCFLLMDAIMSHQSSIKERYRDFQVIDLKKAEDDSAKLTIGDGNGKILVTQDIEYTDFPLDKIRLYAQPGEDGLIILLPSEY